MGSARLPNFDGLDRETLKALTLANQAELAALEAERESQRNILSDQSWELRSSSEQIEHLKLVIEKLRRRVFGVKSEKIVIQLEQLELHLEERESSQAEMEVAVERVRPAEEPETRSVTAHAGQVGRSGCSDILEYQPRETDRKEEDAAIWKHKQTVVFFASAPML